MNRQQKEMVVDLFHNNFLTSKGSFFVNYSGLSVDQMQQLKRQLQTKGAILKVAKMRLVKRALAGIDCVEALDAHCKNQLGVVFANNESEVPGVAKTLADFAKKNQSLELVAGCVDAEFLNSVAIARLASLPSKDVLFALLCGTLRAPLAKLAMILEEVKKQKQEA